MKFEAGTPMIAEVIGLGAAIDYLVDFGLDKARRWEHTLLEYATEQLLHIEGVRIIGTAKDKGGIISFVVDGAHHLDIGTMLDLRGIAIRTGHHCAQPAMRRFGVEGTSRISFGIYNTLDEVDYFIASLKDVIRLLT
jgi:cysteine desulfurase/selenocysteine lyase